jgi:hypothetical protein
MISWNSYLLKLWRILQPKRSNSGEWNACVDVATRTDVAYDTRCRYTLYGSFRSFYWVRFLIYNKFHFSAFFKHNRVLLFVSRLLVDRWEEDLQTLAQNLNLLPVQRFCCASCSYCWLCCLMWQFVWIVRLSRLWCSVYLVTATSCNLTYKVFKVAFAKCSEQFMTSWLLVCCGILFDTEAGFLATSR